MDTSNYDPVLMTLRETLEEPPLPGYRLVRGFRLVDGKWLRADLWAKLEERRPYLDDGLLPDSSPAEPTSSPGNGPTP